MEKINTNLSELAEGSLQERFDHEVAKVTENILDLNTDPEKKRKITITVTLTADDHRDMMYLDAEVKSSLVPRKAVGTKVLIDELDGNVYANELKSGQKGQMFFDTADSKLKDDHGKPVEEIEKEVAAQQVKEPGEIIKFIDDKKSQIN
ncbi:hypothetical protein [Enterococcus sp. AD013-P3]|uniref:hypothetical protein n=1 Tax=Enterococcus sp. AD013-P3 TaxID=3411036 RepID=UPI003B94A9CD